MKNITASFNEGMRFSDIHENEFVTIKTNDGEIVTFVLCAGGICALSPTLDFCGGYSSILRNFKSNTPERYRELCDENGVEDYEYSRLLNSEVAIVDWLLCMERDEGVSFYIPLQSEKVSFISNNYEDNFIYSGLGRYHQNHGGSINNPLKEYKYRFGIELEVEFPNNLSRRRFCTMESNWFWRETDSSLNSYGVEIITVPLLPKDAKNESFWMTLTEKLNDMGAMSWNTGRCGLHVHISKEIFGNTAEEQENGLGKALYLYHQFLKETTINSKIYGRTRAYNSDTCDGKTPESNAVKILGKEALKAKGIHDVLKSSLIKKSKENRYYEINLQNLESIGTLEFRRGRGSINHTRIVSIIEWCELICLYSKQVKWIDISLEGFLKYAKSHTSKKSPLYSKLLTDE